MKQRYTGYDPNNRVFFIWYTNDDGVLDTLRCANVKDEDDAIRMAEGYGVHEGDIYRIEEL